MIRLPQPKAIIFDMDGTLTDNMDFHHRAWMKFIEHKKLGLMPRLLSATTIKVL